MPSDPAGGCGFPAYSYVPGFWPHPHSHPDGHRFGPPFPAPRLDDVASDPTFRLGVSLFDSGYYWEAHEAWEYLWHAAGRKGELADFFKGLIQLAVAGVKVREGRRDGAAFHARRAAELLGSLTGGSFGGFDTHHMASTANAIAQNPPPIPSDPRLGVEIVFAWRLSDAMRGRLD